MTFCGSINSICRPLPIGRRKNGHAKVQKSLRSSSGGWVVGEVSLVNDDNSDNCFYDKAGRFPSIEEDQEPLYLLVNDYRSYYQMRFS